MLFQLDDGVNGFTPGDYCFCGCDEHKLSFAAIYTECLNATLFLPMEGVDVLFQIFQTFVRTEKAEADGISV